MEVFPKRLSLPRASSWSSPRPWRCFRSHQRHTALYAVFSTSVEVFLYADSEAEAAKESSPRPWRCFSNRLSPRRSCSVFSTSVEVFPITHYSELVKRCLLHVRGGVSIQDERRRQEWESSPRPWRCFYKSVLSLPIYPVFSTSVEVFPIARVVSLRSGCLLHVRGGVSGFKRRGRRVRRSSPRPWRCFRNRA